MAQEKKLQEAKRLYETANSDQRYVLESLFPELKEDGDERIRKAIIYFISHTPTVPKGIIGKETMISWLEKQGKKPVEEYNITGISSGHATGKLKEIIKDIESEKVESKFKVGDWIVRGGKTLQISHIDKVLDGTFHYWFTVGTWLSSAKIEDAHLWTINDARDGDVLVASDDSIFLFAGVVDCACKYYVALTACNDVKINKEVDGGYWETSRAVHPATKEQREQLEKAMADAGYTFDFEKKELKKIDQKPTDKEMKEALQAECVQSKVELTQVDKIILEAAIAFVEHNNHFNCWRGVDKHTVLSALHSIKAEDGKRAMKALFDMIGFKQLEKQIDEGKTEFVVTPDKLDDKSKELYNNEIGEICLLAAFSETDNKKEESDE